VIICETYQDYEVLGTRVDRIKPTMSRTFS